MHVHSFIGLLADGAAPAPTGPQSLFASPLVFLALMGIMMYFVVFRPQQQRAKQQAKLLAALKSGDDVVTTSGIVGTVVSVKEKTVTLRSADSKFEVTKASIVEVTSGIPATKTS